MTLETPSVRLSDVSVDSHVVTSLSNLADPRVSAARHIHAEMEMGQWVNCVMGHMGHGSRVTKADPFPSQHPCMQPGYKKSRR